jgi:hypothetical protein
MTTKKPQDAAVTEAAQYFASEAQERIAAAWAELVEAAKSDPKARAFLAAFSPGTPDLARDPESE